MVGVHSPLNRAAAEKAAVDQAQNRVHKQAFRAELYALAVLVGQGMVVVYVIGTLLVNCMQS